MEHILDETVPSADLKKFEQKYHEELQAGKVSTPVLIVHSTDNSTYKLKTKAHIGHMDIQTDVLAK